MATSYEVLAGDSGSWVVLHVPHSSRAIPGWVRERILLDDDELAAELEAMTDAHTDAIAASAVEQAGGSAPWRFVNRCSRLVVDPERFADPELEELAEIGMGAVYTSTHDLRVLRHHDPEHTAALLAVFFRPYADALADLVDDVLRVHGRATVVDVHSYPRDLLPYERHRDAARPRVCLGADPVHTPDGLRAAAEESFAQWEPVWDQPFAGTYVPSRHFRTDPRVSSVMVEIRRDCCVDDTGAPDRVAVAAFGESIRRLASWNG